MMPFKPVILWTDALLFLLIAILTVYFFYVRAKPHLAQLWLEVAHSKRGMAALVFLGFFLCVGVLDSMHFRTRLPATETTQQGGFAVQTHSALDVFAGPLRRNVEKTYSAPLATHLYSKETVYLRDGGKSRAFPRLMHGGAHLEDEVQDWLPDVVRTTMTGIGLATAIWGVLAVILILIVANATNRNFRSTWRSIWRDQELIPWRIILISAAALVVVLVPMMALSANYHVLGTDKVGQDVLYLTLKSIRTGLVIAVLATLVMLPFAMVFGILAGYFRGWIDDIIQYIYTTLSSIPSVLLIAATVLMIQAYMGTHPDMFDTIEQRQDLRLLFLCLILGVTSWTGLCRLLRGETLKLRELEYVEAARAFGVSHRSIITRHIVPNLMHIVLIAIVMDFSGLILAEAVLSYLGVGVDPTMISFGNMINAARLEMAREPIVWWSLASAFTCMLVMVLSANVFADSVRDAFDPRVATVVKRGNSATVTVSA